jgi:hypothetical protein
VEEVAWSLHQHRQVNNSSGFEAPLFFDLDFVPGGRGLHALQSPRSSMSFDTPHIRTKPSYPRIEQITVEFGKILRGIETPVMASRASYCGKVRLLQGFVTSAIIYVSLHLVAPSCIVRDIRIRRRLASNSRFSWYHLQPPTQSRTRAALMSFSLLFQQRRCETCRVSTVGNILIWLKTPSACGYGGRGVEDWRSAISAQPRTIDFSPLASERFLVEQF